MATLLPDLKNRVDTKQKLGSFWYREFSEQDRLEKLIALSRSTDIHARFQAILNDLAGNYDAANYVRHVTVPFNPDSIFKAGIAIFDDDRSNFKYELGSSVRLSYDSDRLEYFGMPLGGYLPFTIRTNAKDYVLGVDFFLLDNRWLMFRNNPTDLFRRNSYHIVHGVTCNPKSVMGYVLDSFVGTGREHVTKFVRVSQTPATLRNALAVIGGLRVLGSRQELKQKIKPSGTGSVIYVFESEGHTVDYPHVELTVGETYDAGPIGDAINVYQGSEYGNAWWKEIDWNGGFLLDPIVGEHNLPLKDDYVYAYNAGADSGSFAGSLVHARLALSDDFDNESAYWERVARMETDSFTFLNSHIGLGEETGASLTFEELLESTETENNIRRIVGLPEVQPDVRRLPTKKLVHAMDTFFTTVLGKHSYVVMVDRNVVRNERDVYSFLNDHLLVGAAPIVVSYSNIEHGVTVTMDTDVVTTSEITVTESETLTVTEAPDLSSIVTEYVLITS